MALWNRQWEGRTEAKEAGSEREKFRQLHPSAESFRDWCYERAVDDSKKKFQDCNGSFGWCLDCPRDERWDKQ